jgi:hypothetical protein
MLERVLFELQYRHNGGTKCEVDVQFFPTYSSVYCQYSYIISQADSYALPEQDVTLFNNLLGLVIFNDRRFQFCVLSQAYVNCEYHTKKIIP